MKNITAISMGVAVGAAAVSVYRSAAVLSRKTLGALMALLVIAVLFLAQSMQAQGTDATAITTAVSAAFPAVAGLCITIGTFFLVYRLVKKIR